MTRSSCCSGGSIMSMSNTRSMVSTYRSGQDIPNLLGGFRALKEAMFDQMLILETAIAPDPRRQARINRERVLGYLHDVEA